MTDFEKTFHESLQDAEKMEALYRQDKAAFARSLADLDPATAPPGFLAFWTARLTWKPAADQSSLWIILGLGLLCWLPLRIFLEFHGNASTLIGTWFPGIMIFCWGLASWFSRGIRAGLRDILSLVLLALLPGLLLQFYPWSHDSQSHVQAMIHAGLLVWAGLALLRFRPGSPFLPEGQAQISRTGETLVWSALFLLGGAILTGLTLWFLGSLGHDAAEFYGNNVVSLGCVMAPFLALHFARPKARLRLSDTLFMIFAPLAALTMVVFLATGILSWDKLLGSKDTFTIYALVPVAAMAVMTLVSNRENPGCLNLWFASVLSAGTALFLVMVLVPAFYRSINWGLTPNKFVVLSISLIMLVQTVMLLIAQIRTLAGKAPDLLIPRTVAGFLPVWAIWAGLVVVVLPLVFNFA